MSTLITILHVCVCLFLMLTVLLQQGKSGMGGAFGGSSAGTVFGGAGASSFLRKLTAAAATIFMITSMILAYVASRDAGEPLERLSKTEADRLRAKKEAERKGFESALDGGIGDGGAAPTDPAAGSGATTPTDPAAGSGATGASGAGGAMVPAEMPAPATGTTPPTATPPATPPAATPPAAPPPAAPTGAAPAAPAPAGGAAGSATP